MKTTDALLLAPAAACAVGVLAYALMDVPLPRLCLLVAAPSLAALLLHWVLSRAHR